MLDALLTMGAFRQGDMGGDRPVDWPEIHGFARSTGRVTEPWELEALFEMSHRYIEGRRTGQSPFGISPIDQISEDE